MQNSRLQRALLCLGAGAGMKDITNHSLTLKLTTLWRRARGSVALSGVGKWTGPAWHLLPMASQRIIGNILPWVVRGSYSAMALSGMDAKRYSRVITRHTC